MPNFPFSQEDCKQILQMLNKNKSSFVNQVGNSSKQEELSGKAFCFTRNGKKNVWILDSGATYHIVCNPDFLTSLRPVENHTVQLPNGSFAKVTHVGQITFSSNLVLDNVVCVPFFTLNLISISKLAYDSLYITIFQSQFCVIQDLRSGKMIGMGLERERLYYLDPPKKGTCNTVQTSPSSFWHQRLGHPSHKVSMLFPFFQNKSCDSNKCFICPLAKQTRLPFSLSSISTLSCFELIHVDI